MKFSHHFSLIVALSLCSLQAALTANASLNFTYFDVPNAVNTIPMGIYQDTIVGIYTDSSQNFHGFIKQDNTYTTLDNPNGGSIIPRAVYGNTVVGQWSGTDNRTHGFIYTNNQFTNLDVPNAKATYITGIYGASVVGSYTTPDNLIKGFLYSNNQITYINYPTGDTRLTGINQNTIQGYSTANQCLFLYTDNTFTTHIPTTPPLLNRTLYASGFYNDTIVGYTINSGVTSFIDINNSFSTFTVPNSQNTWAMGIYENTIVGEYSDSASTRHGFLATLDIPEPTSLSLLASACLLLVRRSRK